MIVDYKTFKPSILESVEKPSKIGQMSLVGKPSGEYLEISVDEFSVLNDNRLLMYDTLLKIMTFQDKDYDKIVKFLNIKKIDQNKENIKRFLDSVHVVNYKINEDYTVDVLGNVKIRKDLHNLPVKFDYVMGDFDISSCQLSTLRGCPDVVGGDFISTNNMITTLEGGPMEVTGNYDVRQCNLTSLKGSPEKINRDFLCSYNGLVNLIGGPKIVDGSYKVDNCLLKTLEGAPDLLSNNFDCSYNFLEDLLDGPDMINGIYDCSYNNLQTLEGGPSSVGTFNCRGNRHLNVKQSQNLLPFANEIIT